MLDLFSVVSCMVDLNEDEFRKLILRINLSKMKEEKKEKKKKKKEKYQSILSNGEIMGVEVFYVSLDVKLGQFVDLIVFGVIYCGIIFFIQCQFQLLLVGDFEYF